MDFSFSDEQEELRELARKILSDFTSNDRLKDVEAKTPVFDPELWRELGRANLLGLAIPEEHGGLGFGYFELCLLLQEIGRSVAPVPVYATALLGALPILRFGSDDQKQAWLPKVAAGEAILSAALVELSSEDLCAPDTTAEPSTGSSTGAEGSFVLSGEKTLVPAAQLADRIVVSARTQHGAGLYLVDPKADGARVETQQTTDRQPYGHLTLEDAPAEALPGADAAALRWLSDRATVGLCAIQLGVGERALEMTAQYAQERVQFDRPIGSFQAVHQRAGDAFIQMEAVRLTFLEAAILLAEEEEDKGEATADAVSIAKYWASEGGQFNAYACQHLHGGIGIDVDYPLHRYFIWSTQLEHTLGCASAQLQILGERIAERGLPST